jgi:RND superfamily putative drug exporter
MGNRSLLFERWPRYAFRHAWQVLAATFVVLIVLGAAYSAGAGAYADAFSIPGVESQRLFDLLEQRFPATAGDAVTVAVRAPRGVNDPAVKPQVQDLVRRLSGLPEVVEVSSPYESAGAISPDGAIARINVQYDKRATAVSKSSTEALLDLRKEVSRSDFEVEAGGLIVQRAEREPPGSSEFIGISAAVVILLLAFGSVVAMGMPIITAMLGLSSGFFLVGLGAAFVDLPSFTPQFAAMIGIGVGIDYALLVVNRFREALARGMSPEDATVKAAGTAGRSVFFAGGTVVIALLGLWASGTPAIGWLGTGGALVVALSVTVALVVLPAILSLLGPHINRWRIPGLAPAGIDDETGVGYRLSRIVQRAPLLFMLVSLGFLLVLTIPVLDIRLGISDAGNNPQSFTSRRAYDLISQGFGPGTNGRIVVGLQIDDQAGLTQVKQLPEMLKGTQGVQAVSPVRFNGDQSAATIAVTPLSAPQDSETVDLVHNLRTTLHQQFTDTGATPLVGGSTALTIDLSDRNASRLPYFLGAVLALSFLLLMAVFRSIAVPVKAALMNLLSIGASFGVLVAIFQWGWLGSLFGVNREGPVEAFLPMMLFAVLFGLSMDYEVFLVSRIREEYLETLDNTESVARGLSVTTRVITAAAGIMVAVFIAFAASDQRVVKEFGIGLATAIFLDATVVRLILVPSLMQLMGKWNWWLPAWLDRILPRLTMDPPPSRTTKPAVKPGLATRD